MKKIIFTITLIISNYLSAQQRILLSDIEWQSNLNLSAKTESTIKSSIYASLDIDLLKSDIETLYLQLPNGINVTIEMTQMLSRSSNKFSWFGNVKDEIDSKINFAIVDDYVSGSIFLKNTVFEIVALGHNKIQINELNTQNFDQCGGGINPDIYPEINHQINQRQTNVNKGIETTLDVLIVYSNDTLSALGSHAAVESTAQASIDNMNTALSNSLLNTGIDEVRLLTVLPIDRDESDSSATELSWLRDDDNVNYLRNLYGADMVSMLTATTGCGRGYVMSSPGAFFSESAFQVTKYSCAVGNLSMAHEFGHNLGLEHNPEDSSRWPDNGSYPYSFAQYHNGSYRTVMSYASQCTSGCSRKMYYSNPDVMHLGLPTGVVDLKDNTRSLEQTTLFAVDFRQFVENIIFMNGFE